MHFLRKGYLQYILKVKIGENVFIHLGCRFEGNIAIGKNSVIGRKVVLIGNILIGENVSITAESYLFSMSHDANDINFGTFDKAVVINDYCWLGVRSIVMPGVIMGKGSILGANSVATKNILEFSIYLGIPAKFHKSRNPSINYQLNYSPFFQ
jgi:acetyltransferase-like isoleucine patch superfamily enzyme